MQVSYTYLEAFITGNMAYVKGSKIPAVYLNYIWVIQVNEYALRTFLFLCEHASKLALVSV